MPATYAAIRVAVAGLCAGQQIVNVFNVAGGGDVQEVTEAVGDAYVAAFDSFLPETYTFDSAHGIDMSSATGGTFTHPLTAGGAGGGSDAAEIGLAGIIRWSDTITGRAFRPGRTFIGPILRVYVSDVGLTLNSGGRTALLSAANTFLGAVNAVGSLVIVHGLGTPGQQVAPVTAAAVATNLAHLDSRRR